MNSKLLRKIIAPAVATLPTLPEWLDAPFQAKHHLPFWKNALEQVHAPKSETDLLPTAPARLRLAYDEILANQLALLLVRARHKKQSGQVIQGTGYLVQKLKGLLPFSLTGAQERVLIEIQRDMEDSARMSRLLQGDVGSGKTIVALLSMITATDTSSPTPAILKRRLTSIFLNPFLDSDKHLFVCKEHDS